MDSVAQLPPGLADDQRPPGSVIGVTIPPSCEHSPPVNRPSLVQPADGRSLLSASVGMTLVAAGAVLRFAVTAMFAHVAGIIVMLAGIVALLLSLLVWGSLSRSRLPGRGPSTGSQPPPKPEARAGGKAGRPGSAGLSRQNLPAHLPLPGPDGEMRGVKA